MFFRTYVNNNQDNCPDLLPMAEFAHKNHVLSPPAQSLGPVYLWLNVPLSILLQSYVPSVLEVCHNNQDVGKKDPENLEATAVKAYSNADRHRHLGAKTIPGYRVLSTKTIWLRLLFYKFASCFNHPFQMFIQTSILSCHNHSWFATPCIFPAYALWSLTGFALRSRYLLCQC